MKRAIADLAPELLRDEKFAEARQYLRADHDKAEVARSKGLFHSEGLNTFLGYTLPFITEMVLTDIRVQAHEKMRNMPS
jgi:hypothetical protein